VDDTVPERTQIARDGRSWRHTYVTAAAAAAAAAAAEVDSPFTITM